MKKKKEKKKKRYLKAIILKMLEGNGPGFLKQLKNFQSLCDAVNLFGYCTIARLCIRM